MDAANPNPDTPQDDEPQPSRAKRYRPIVIALVVLGVFLSLAFLYVRNSPFMTPDVPGVTLTDIHSIDDLEARFNQDAGQTRLILFVSPT
jgi:hypothetical protein